MELSLFAIIFALVGIYGALIFCGCQLGRIADEMKRARLKR